MSMEPQINRRRVNRISDLTGFLRRWDDNAQEENSILVQLRRTEFGNINSSGTLGDYEAPALSKWHFQFQDALEPGVRDLVLLFVYKFGWVTYTSCQGHSYEEFDLPPVERHIGIIPRSQTEMEEICTALKTAAYSVNNLNPNSAACVVVWPVGLECQEALTTAIDLIFLRRENSSWSSYFWEVDIIYRQLLETLSNITRDNGVNFID